MATYINYSYSDQIVPNHNLLRLVALDTTICCSLWQRITFLWLPLAKVSLNVNKCSPMCIVTENSSNHCHSIHRHIPNYPCNSDWILCTFIGPCSSLLSLKGHSHIAVALNPNVSYCILPGNTQLCMIASVGKARGETTWYSTATVAAWVAPTPPPPPHPPVDQLHLNLAIELPAAVRLWRHCPRKGIWRTCYQSL